MAGRSASRWGSLRIIAVTIVFLLYSGSMLLMGNKLHSDDPARGKFEEEVLRKQDLQIRKEAQLEANLENIRKEISEVKKEEMKKEQEVEWLRQRIEALTTSSKEITTNITSFDGKVRNLEIAQEDIKRRQQQAMQAMSVPAPMNIYNTMHHPAVAMAATPKPTTPAGLTEQCKKRTASLLESREPWLFIGAETNKGKEALSLDITAGTASLWIGMTNAAENCFRFATNSVDIDPYIEAHRLKNHPSTHECDRQLTAHLNEHFGKPTDPNFDVWHVVTSSRHISSNKVTGMMLHLSIRPRKDFPTDKKHTVNFRLPLVCLKPMPQEYPNVIQNISIVFNAPQGPTVKLAGDLQEGLHDGVLADGGRSGTLVASHGYRWNWIADSFLKDTEKLLEQAFGTVDAGHSDAIIKGWDEKTLNFVLGPRAISRNMCGLKVLRFRDVPKGMLLQENGQASEEDLPIPEEVVIEDVITPYVELESEAVPFIGVEKFLSGGLKIDLQLHAGVFFSSTTSSSIEDAIQHQLRKSYGEPDTPDTVKVITPTAVAITLSRRSMMPAWISATNESASSHRVLKLPIPSEILVTPKYNCSCACYHPEVSSCTYNHYTGDELVAFPSIVVELKERLQVKWAVVGAGPSGMNGLGRVLDLWKGNESQILWIDERGFKVGRLEGYHDVQSMNPCSDFLAFMNDYEYYKSFPLGESKKPLMAYEGNKKHCRLGFLSEPLLKATHIIRSRLISMTGRVTDMHKVYFANSTKHKDSTDFVWSIRVGNRDPVWVTDGVVLAIGADHHAAEFAFTPPTEIPFVTALNPGMLRAFINKDIQSKSLTKTGKTVAVFGAGPSGVVALHNLALIPEVDKVIHIPKVLRQNDYTLIQTVKPNGQYLNITRMAYDRNTIKGILANVDYQIQCIGWRFPSFPYNGSIMVSSSTSSVYVSPKLFNVGVKHTPNGVKSQLFFISSLRSMSRASSQCKVTQNTECLTKHYGPIPTDLVDPNAAARGGYNAT
eukprot:TRINITY_DN19102_c0_g1_i1.p1 TRINITY_DN19102_c0_g1~~TRINITY_DN19102_c0_g1_i1.p1  ORF type:complete len:1000 (+),score=231.86 TRINITY_DN19102_c0_g1_i1:47-3046(+)